MWLGGAAHGEQVLPWVIWNSETLHHNEGTHPRQQIVNVLFFTC